jgi:hypothetical protein
VRRQICLRRTSAATARAYGPSPPTLPLSALTRPTGFQRSMPGQPGHRLPGRSGRTAPHRIARDDSDPVIPSPVRARHGPLRLLRPCLAKRHLARSSFCIAPARRRPGSASQTPADALLILATGDHPLAAALQGRAQQAPCTVKDGPFRAQKKQRPGSGIPAPAASSPRKTFSPTQGRPARVPWRSWRPRPSCRLASRP